MMKTTADVPPQVAKEYSKARGPKPFPKPPATATPRPRRCRRAQVKAPSQFGLPKSPSKGPGLQPDRIIEPVRAGKNMDKDEDRKPCLLTEQVLFSGSATGSLTPQRASRSGPTSTTAEDDGFAAGLTNCITKDGQTTHHPEHPVQLKRITGLADPINPQDAATKAYTDTKLNARGGPLMTGDLIIRNDAPAYHPRRHRATRGLRHRQHDRTASSAG